MTSRISLRLPSFPKNMEEGFYAGQVVVFAATDKCTILDGDPLRYAVADVVSQCDMRVGWNRRLVLFLNPALGEATHNELTEYYLGGGPLHIRSATSNELVNVLVALLEGTTVACFQSRQWAIRQVRCAIVRNGAGAKPNEWLWSSTSSNDADQGLERIKHAVGARKLQRMRMKVNAERIHMKLHFEGNVIVACGCDQSFATLLRETFDPGREIEMKVK